MKLTLGFSPCPNDTFIFDAMVHGRIDTEGIDFDYRLADVEQLNRSAFEGNIDITKMSLPAYAEASSKYKILDSGSALGYRNGPLLISRKGIDKDAINNARIAIPGRYTTANLLFSLAWPEAVNKTEYLFSDIEDLILNDKADAGLIIHESRFTYEKKGLKLIADLGEFWENQSGLPIPLGIIAISRRLSEDIMLKVNRIIQRSLEFAFNDALASYDFVSENAREMDRDVMNQHIKLYVNKFSLSHGVVGRKAIKELYRQALMHKLIGGIAGDIFVVNQ